MGVEKKRETDHAFIWIDEEGILNMRIKDGAKIGQQDLRNIFQVYKELGCYENKALQLIEGSRYFTMDKEGIKETFYERRNYAIASATISTSLSMVLLFKFIQSVYKPDPPIGIFRSKGEALTWLRSFKPKEGK